MPNELTTEEWTQGPMSPVDYLLSHIAQECNEVAIRCTKAQHFGLDEIEPDQPLTNRQRIVEELYDLYALVHLATSNGVLPEVPPRGVMERFSAKDAKAKKFRCYSRQLGRLEP